MPTPVVEYLNTQTSGTNVPDTSGNGLNGTLTGSSPPTWAGTAPYGLVFDGTTNCAVLLPNTVLANDNTSIKNASIEAWVKTDGSTDGIIVTLAGDDFVLDVKFGLFRGYAFGTGVNLGSIASLGVPADTSWHHVVSTLDATDTWNIYVDGVFVTNNTFSHPNIAIDLRSSGGNKYLGADILYTENCFNGTLGEIRIYNVALSSANIATLYSTTSSRYLGGGALSLTGPTSTAILATGYSSSLIGNSGTPTYTYSIISGSLPTGLSLNTSTGAITGTPSVPGIFVFTGQVIDSVAATASGSFTITVEYSLTCASATTGAVGSLYSSSLAVTGGYTPLTFSINSGSLPPGLSLNSTTGILSGTPTSIPSDYKNSYTYSAQVIDFNGNTTSSSCSITITQYYKLVYIDEINHFVPQIGSSLTAFSGPYEFVDSIGVKHLYVWGVNSSQQRTAVYKSDDSGVTWVEQDPTNAPSVIGPNPVYNYGVTFSIHSQQDAPVLITGGILDFSSGTTYFQQFSFSANLWSVRYGEGVYAFGGEPGIVFTDGTIFSGNNANSIGNSVPSGSGLTVPPGNTINVDGGVWGAQAGTTGFAYGTASSGLDLRGNSPTALLSAEVVFLSSVVVYVGWPQSFPGLFLPFIQKVAGGGGAITDRYYPAVGKLDSSVIYIDLNSSDVASEQVLVIVYSYLISYWINNTYDHLGAQQWDSIKRSINTGIGFPTSSNILINGTNVIMPDGTIGATFVEMHHMSATLSGMVAYITGGAVPTLSGIGEGVFFAKIKGPQTRSKKNYASIGPYAGVRQNSAN